jgi:hypothetical protein
MRRAVIVGTIVIKDIDAALCNDQLGRKPGWLRVTAPLFSVNRHKLARLNYIYDGDPFAV